MLGDKTVCIHHEARNQLIQDHGERIAVIEVEVEHMQGAQSALVERFDSAATKNELAVKEMCAEVKKINLRLAALFSEPGNHVRSKEAGVVDPVEVLDHEPIGWLNSALRKIFKSPVFWVLFGWAVIKILFFGEYPWFTDKVRPYMKPAVEMKKEMTESHQALHDAGIYHLHNEKGNPVLPANGNGNGRK